MLQVGLYLGQQYKRLGQSASTTISVGVCLVRIHHPLRLYSVFCLISQNDSHVLLRGNRHRYKVSQATKNRCLAGYNSRRGICFLLPVKLCNGDTAIVLKL